MRYLILALFLFLISVYPFFATAVIVKKKTRNLIFLFIFGSYLAYLLICRLLYSDQPLFMSAATGTILLCLPLLTMTLFLLAEDVCRLIIALIRSLVRNLPLKEAFPKKTKWNVILSVIVSFALLIIFLAGTTSWKYKFTVREVTIHTDRLPAGIDSLRIVHISDLHIGSFSRKAPLKDAVKKINLLQPDLIFFTGDMFNSETSEIEPWMDILSGLDARFGKFSIMGNHDYGNYKTWRSSQEKEANLNAIPVVYDQLGMELLNNRHVSVAINGDTVFVAGVENWGLPPFPQKGDLEQAVRGIPDSAFILLLSHDPDHFAEVVYRYTDEIFMTFSGHTHGFQIGFECPDGCRWSPSQYFYKHWAGLYRQNGRYLYVNRGLGFLGFKGRVGIWPEITLIRLIRDNP